MSPDGNFLCIARQARTNDFLIYRKDKEGNNFSNLGLTSNLYGDLTTVIYRTAWLCLHMRMLGFSKRCFYQMACMILELLLFQLLPRYGILYQK